MRPSDAVAKEGNPLDGAMVHQRNSTLSRGALMPSVAAESNSTAVRESPRILVIRLRRLGDLLLATPMLRAIRLAYPAARIDVLVQAGLIELEWLKQATLEALRAQLLQRPYHIFHFIGHGGFDAGEQDGILIFENANGYANRVSGERLAVILGNHRTLRLAVLNACEGARTSQQDPFAGTAMTWRWPARSSALARPRPRST